MPLYFENVQLLQYSHTPVRFDAGLRYKIEKKFTINGRLVDNTYSGPATVLRKEDAVIAGATDYDTIILNGVSFGTGKITGISFAGGNMVREDNYTYDIVAYDDGDLTNMSGGVYTGVALTSGARIESLSESFNFDENEAGDKNYAHSVSIRYAANTTRTAAIASAKSLMQNLLGAVSGLTAFLNTYAGISTARRVYSENYDLISCECSIDESVSIPRTNAGTYSYSYEYETELGAGGFTQVTETLTIQGLTNPPYAGALAGYNALANGAYTRVDAVYDAYGFSSANLAVLPISSDTSIDRFNGKIVIKQRFSNDPRYINLAIWERTMELSRDNDNYYTVTESGSVTGRGKLSQRLTNAKNFYASPVLSGIVARINTAYASTGRSTPLINIGIKKSQDEFRGQINYSFSYTDNTQLQNADIRQTEISIVDDLPVHLVQKYDVFNQKQVVQTQQQSTLGRRSIQVALKGKRTLVPSDYLVAAKAVISANLPPYTDYYLDNCQYSFSKERNSFSLSANFVWVGAHKTRNSLTIA